MIDHPKWNGPMSDGLSRMEDMLRVKSIADIGDYEAAARLATKLFTEGEHWHRPLDELSRPERQLISLVFMETPEIMPEHLNTLWNYGFDQLSEEDVDDQ